MARVMTVAVLATMLFFFAGCSSVRVSQDYRPGSDFSIYHTYDWQSTDSRPSGNIRLDNPLLHERFHQAIDRVLALKGYTRQQPADFLVSYSYQTESRIRSYPYGYGGYAGLGRLHRHGGLDIDDYYDIEQYDVGIIAINIYDAASGTLIWRGVGSDIVDIHAAPEKTSAFVDRLVDADLAQFPPPREPKK